MGPVVLVLAAYAALFGAGEWIHRVLGVPPDTSRRYIHLCSGLFTLLVPTWLSREAIIGLAIVFAGGLGFSKRWMLLRSIHGTQRITWGEVFFPLGIGLAAALYLPQAPKFYYLSLLILACSDPLANWVGGRVASYPLPFHKTVLGSLIFFASSLLIALGVLAPGQALLVAVCATVGEALGPYGSDNAVIIPAVGLALLV